MRPKGGKANRELIAAPTFGYALDGARNTFQSSSHHASRGCGRTGQSNRIPVPVTGRCSSNVTWRRGRTRVGHIVDVLMPIKTRCNALHIRFDFLAFAALVLRYKFNGRKPGDHLGSLNCGIESRPGLVACQDRF